MKRGLALIAAVLTALLAAVVGRCEEHRHDDHRRRQHVRLTARLGVDAGSRLGVRLHGAVQRRRLRRRDRVDHEPPGRLRRVRRTADARPVHRLQGLRADPVGALGDHGRLQRPGRSGSPESRRADDREDLPRRHHELERPGDQGAEQGRQPARPEDHPGLPLGRLGYDVQLHRLPVGGQPRPGSRRSAISTQPRVPDRHRRDADRPAVAGVVSRTSGGITYVDVAYAITNHIKFAAVKNAAGKFLFPSLRRIAAAAAAFPKVPAQQRDAHREPAEVGAARVPDLAPTPT